MFKIIINCGPCEEFIDKCLGSVLLQTVQDWEVFVTCDPCGDNTFDKAISFTCDPRVRFRLNPVRKFSMLNQIEAIYLSGTDPEDVIVSLDGDDWFNRIDALQLIADTYEKYHCWMTYGSWVTNRLTIDGQLWPAYPDGTTNFREWSALRYHTSSTPWLATAVRTWKRWLWNRINPRDFKDDKGEYFRVAEDRAIMLPMLEMSGTERAKHIAEPLMMYNQLLSNSHPELEEEALVNVRIIHSRPPYKLIER